MLSRAIIDGVVHGAFKSVDRVHSAQSTPGLQHFCAYLLFYATGATTSTTTARATHSFRIPS